MEVITEKENIKNDKQNELIDVIKKLTKEIEKNNSCLSKDKKIEKHDVLYYIKRYIQEVLEASLGLLAVMYITKREFVLNDFLKIVSIIGLMTLILEEYNISAAQNFKQGIHFTMGASAFN